VAGRRTAVSGFVELGQARSDPTELILGAATLVLSWFFVHTVFAFHYAHIYYRGPGIHGHGKLVR